MTKNALIKLGFEFESISNGWINFKHRKRFILNGSIAITRKGGYWMRTIEKTSLDKAAAYITCITFEI